MRALVQRVLESSVSVDGEVVGRIGKGFNVLLGVVDGDTAADAELLAAKVTKLRIFEDENEKMNLSALDTDAQMLVISQFTLCADCRKGNRPSFTDSAPPEQAKQLYEYFSDCLRGNGIKKVENGVFAADMCVNIVNDGPVTILLDTNIWNKKD